MSRVRESIDVAVPVHVAYERLCHFEEYPQFMAGVQEVTRITEDISHWVMDLDGTHAEFDARIVDQRPDEMLSWCAIDGPQLAETVTLQPLDEEHTRIIAELELEARALMPSEAYGQDSLDRRLKADLDGFKHYIEDTLPGMSHLASHNVMPANPSIDDGGIRGGSPAGMPTRRPGSGPTGHADGAGGETRGTGGARGMAGTGGAAQAPLNSPSRLARNSQAARTGRKGRRGDS